METYVVIKEFPHYEVSNIGNVRSFKRSKSVKVLKPGMAPNGYLGVYLSNEERKTTLKIHRLVAQYFVVNPLDKNEVNHKDGNKQNNRSENLEWTTRKENAEHASVNLLYSHGESHLSAKLCERDVMEIRRFHSEGHSQISLAKKFSVCQPTVFGIVHRKKWKHVK